MPITTAYPQHLYKNAGAFSQGELERLANSRVAVGGLGAFGMGAVGLAQLGIGTGPAGQLRIADPDVFEAHNSNRQAEAIGPNLGRNKTEVVGARIRGLVPEIRLECFQEGITLENLDAFLQGVDLVLDAVDFLVPEVKLELHRRARAAGIPVISGLLVQRGAVGYLFEPDGPSFQDFFGFPADPELRRSWVMPMSRILGAGSSFWARSEVRRHTYEVLTGRTHITSNPLAASAAHLLMNHMAVSRLLGRDVPSIPRMMVLDPDGPSLGALDLGEAVEEQRSSIWTRIAPVYDRVLVPSDGATVYGELLDKMVRDLAGRQRVLEAGCGTGMIAERLARSGAEVLGIDTNHAMLAQALRRARTTERLFVGEGDVEDLFFEDGSFDGYCSNNVVFDADLERTLSEAYRVLKSRGKLAISSCSTIPDLDALGGTVEHLVSLGVPESDAREFLQCQVEMYQGRALRHGLQAHGTERVTAVLRRLGFREILKTETAYRGINFYVVAVK